MSDKQQPMSGTYNVKSSKAMKALAKKIASHCQGGSLLLLDGPLGAGKTTFVQGLAAALGVKEQVNSPTFTITSEYKAAAPGIEKLIHVDLYRLTPAHALVDPSIQHVLDHLDSNSLLVIEWADRLTNHNNTKAAHINFSHVGNNERQVTIE